MNLTSLPSLPRSMFAYRVEERLSLRVIVLALGWWVALSLGWVGTPLWIWVGGSALLSAGHAFSWLFRSLKTPLRSAVMAVSVVGSLVLVPRTVSLAATGDLLPVAHFLLLFQAITSFELRTRGGLYTSIGISGAIFFLVSQRSLDASFGVLVKRLARERAEIVRVVLFGSLARGDAVPGSDVDLLVVIAASDRSFLDRMPLYKPTDVPIGVDVFPYTEEELASMLDEGNAFVREALSEGSVLFERTGS